MVREGNCPRHTRPGTQQVRRHLPRAPSFQQRDLGASSGRRQSRSAFRSPLRRRFRSVPACTYVGDRSARPSRRVWQSDRDRSHRSCSDGTTPSICLASVSRRSAKTPVRLVRGPEPRQAVLGTRRDEPGQYSRAHQDGNPLPSTRRWPSAPGRAAVGDHQRHLQQLDEDHKNYFRSKNGNSPHRPVVGKRKGGSLQTGGALEKGSMTIAVPKRDVQVSLLARTEDGASRSPRPSPCAGGPRRDPHYRGRMLARHAGRPWRGRVRWSEAVQLRQERRSPMPNGSAGRYCHAAVSGR